MQLKESLLAELEIEAALTRKMLARVPPASLAWKPHEKSRTLGELAAHMANIFGLFIAPLAHEEFDRHTYAATTETVAEILNTFEQNLAHARETLRALSEERMLATWRYKYGAQTIFALPRVVVIRTTAFNHLIHHRGQLSVYLRLLQVPLPALYGPSADET